jgi:hypothetical protein
MNDIKMDLREIGCEDVNWHSLGLEQLNLGLYF